MLHLRCRITFSVDVANLLQLQCTLKGHRILESTAQIDEIASVCKRTAQVSYLIVELQHFLHLGRNVPKLFCNLLIFISLMVPLSLPMASARRIRTVT